MGLCQSEEEKKNAKNSREIDKRIKENQATEEKIIKLLLL
uniref:Uncharacterized protein n=1 Tax=Steinernema glaseri TaxID=37863 RepID=A0A1I8AH16_9BILA